MRRADPSERQYGPRTSEEVRHTMLRLTHEFVLAARALSGVERIALIGSLATLKPRPKDIDLLVTIGPSVPFDRLARFGRRLAGQAQSAINAGADVFLADPDTQYLGRVCHYRECWPRVLCRARHCGARQHLCDDFDLVQLKRDTILAPALVLHPRVESGVPVPEDVARLLIAPLSASAEQSVASSRSAVQAI